MKTLTLKMICLFGFILTSLSCKKMVEVDLPVDKITAETTYGSVNTAVSALNSVYADLAGGSVVNLMVPKLSMAADELKFQFPDIDYQNNFSDPGSSLFSIWRNFYATDIYRLNSLIEGVTSSKGIPEKSKKILISEAKFTRGFLYFYLVNFYGDVPLILTTDFKTNSNIPRSSVENVYRQIVSDLQQSYLDLPENYLRSDLSTITSDRVRPTKMACSALLSRVYLFHGDWELAEKEASRVILNTQFTLTQVENVFEKNSSETIWALQPNFLQQSSKSNNTWEGQYFNSRFGTVPAYQITSYLLDSFEANDRRKTNWLGIISNSGINYYYPNKYKIGQNNTQDIQNQEEFSVLFRLAEQYLIRAESRARLNKLFGLESAKSDLDLVRRRAGLDQTMANSQNEFLEAIWRERRTELFTEWGGFRWLDLKRTQKIDDVMGIVAPQKGGVWTINKALLPIPYFEFTTNPALKGHQNPGYPENL